MQKYARNKNKPQNWAVIQKKTLYCNNEKRKYIYIQMFTRMNISLNPKK